MRYFINYDFHALAIADEKPEPIKKNQRYDHSLSEWVEIDEVFYKKMFRIYYKEAESF